MSMMVIHSTVLAEHMVRAVTAEQKIATVLASFWATVGMTLNYINNHNAPCRKGRAHTPKKLA